MSCHYVRSFISSVLLLLTCVATVSAQTSIYHIWDPAKVGTAAPGNAGVDRYYATLQVLRDNVSYLGYSSTNNIIDVVLHNDDESLSSPLWIDYYPSRNLSSVITVKSDAAGAKRTIQAKQSRVFDFYTYYYTDETDAFAHLILSEDIRITGVKPESEEYDYYESGGINVSDGKLTARGTEFSTNYGYYGGAIYADYQENYEHDNFLTVIDADYAIFSENHARHSGGAVHLDRAEMSARNAVFSDNKAWRYYEYDWGDEIYSYYNANGGGAIFLTNQSKAELENARFEGNETLSSYSSWYYDNRANGGAILSENSDLSLRGATFKSNIASGSGGAIFFDVNDGGRYSLQLGASAGGTSLFEGNLHGCDPKTREGVSNSIVFANTSLLESENEIEKMGAIVVDIDIERSGLLNMDDPMEILDLSSYGYSRERGLEIAITKTGEGTWKLAKANELGGAKGGTKVDIVAGTLQLADGAALNLTGLSHSLDRLSVAAYAQLTVGDGTSGATNVLSTSNFQMAGRSRLQLNNDLEIAIPKYRTFGIEDPSRLAATLSGNGNLEKTGDGTLTFAGESTSYTGDVTVSEGTFLIDADARLSTTGDFTLRADAVLAVVGNSAGSTNVAKVLADRIILDDDAIVSISGVSDTAGAEYLILQSNNRIVGDPIEQSPYTGKIDYMDVVFWFNDNHTEYYAKVDLRWFASDDKLASGTFTIDPSTGPDSFNVAVNLHDRNDLGPDASWDGKTLFKDGTGTLELSKANTYTGKTLIEKGTLLVTHSKGTARTEAVAIGVGGRLALDFKDLAEADYDRLIYGDGTLVKAGTGTIRLTNTENDYFGGTILEGGVLSVETQGVLGAGPLTFSGGTLRNTEAILGFDLDIKTVAQQDVRLDTQDDLWFRSDMTGEGGLVKTGQAVLTLGGTASYQGRTQVKEGTLSVVNWNSLGRGDVVLSDGTTFRNLGTLEANGQSFVLEKAASGQSVGNVFDIATNDMTISGGVSGGGMLHKTGEAVLALTGENTYSGGTRIDAGTVSISSAASLGIGSLYFNGGTLRNSAAIEPLGVLVNLLGGNAARFDTRADLTLASSISGNGDLVKTGDATLTLLGTNTYSGLTYVDQGKLVVSGRIGSQTYVAGGATLAGGGTIGGDVFFGEGAAYEWNCNYKIEDSPYLTVMGDVDFDGAVFRPVTSATPDYFGETVNGRTVLRYFGDLTGDGRFVAVDDSRSPFIDFELDYSTPGMIKVVTYDRNTPRTLSDSVAAGLNMAQVRAHRKAFDQIDNTLREGRQLGLPMNDGILRRGQSPAAGRNLWADIYGRSTEYESTYYENSPWRMNSFGFQAGYSFVATNWLHWGLTAGVEFPELKNYRDRIGMSDAFLGLYYGRRISGMWELKGYLGGGTQRYSLRRSDSRFDYRTRYYGESFQANVELARPFRLRKTLVRPFVGFDLEYASQQASIESRVSTEYRAYSKASLTRLFFRVGLDLEKRFERGDLYSGISYANAIAGDSTPCVDVYYPTVGKNATVRGSNLGQNMVTFRIGGNRYFDPTRSRTLFLNLTADVYADRAGGQGEYTGTIGYRYQY